MILFMCGEDKKIKLFFEKGNCILFICLYFRFRIKEK